MRIEEVIHQKKFKNEFEKLIINLIYTSSWISAKHSRLLKPYGLSSQQYNILRILKGQLPKPSSVNLLINRMIDKNSNASRLVEKLRLKGLVERRTSAEDRRQVDVIITKKGLEILRQLDDQYIDFEKNIHTLNEQEAQQVNFLLDKLRGASVQPMTSINENHSLNIL